MFFLKSLLLTTDAPMKYGINKWTGFKLTFWQIKLCREKLYKSLLVFASPGRSLWLSRVGRKLCNFAYCRLLENVIVKQSHLGMKKVYWTRNT